MIQFLARELIGALRELDEIKDLAESYDLDDGKGFAAHSLWIVESIKTLSRLAKLLELTESAGRCDRFIKSLEQAVAFPPEYLKLPSDIPFKRFHKSEIHSEVDGIKEALWKELKGKNFTYIPHAQLEFYEQEKPFGNEVFDNFKSARDEVKNAGNCIAADLYSGAVFYLMRVAEHGLRELAQNDPVKAVLSYPIEWSGWQQMIDKIQSHKDNVIDPMPRGPAKDEEMAFFQTALIECNYFKDLWRNPSMHTRLNPTKDDARSVYTRTKVFMQSLAKRVKEN